MQTYPSASGPVPADALELHESVSLVEAANSVGDGRFTPLPGSVFDAQGRVPVVVIRPGVGKGKGRHLYEARMLEENAHKFAGWKMFINHQSPEAKKAAGGLPRDVRDLGGRLTETWWDPAFPADPVKGHDQGAVLGLARPVPFIRELVENDPDILEASIAASATGVHPKIVGGQRAWCVEGIHDRGSLDWVTEAGAGGRVAPLLEAAYSSDEDMDTALLESLTDDEFKQYIRSNRPDLDLAEAGSLNPNEGDEMDVTPEALQEAISKSPHLLVEAMQQSPEAQSFLVGLMEATLEQEREVIRAEVRAETQREMALRDMRDEAHAVIAESRLPESWQSGLRARFDLVEGSPTADLDVADEVDDDGNVTKAALATLRESVETAIADEQARLRDASPTRVRNQGASASVTPGSRSSSAVKPSDTGWGRFLQENAHTNPDDAFAIRGVDA